ncbi:MAG: HAD family phosphatase [Acidimicrobiia bacterium]
MNLHGLECDAVLFDCDGVLVDSEPVSLEAWSEALAVYGYVLDAEVFAESIGGTEAMVANRFAPDVGVDPVVLELEAQRAFQQISSQAGAFGDTLALIDRLECAGVPIGVATNGLRWRLDALLGAVGLGRLLPFSVTADEVENPKPAPDLYLRAASLAGTVAERCVVIEDSPTGVAAAKAAGCLVVAVDRGVFDRRQLAGADVVVDQV